MPSNYCRRPNSDAISRLEYLTGYFLEVKWGTRWWDYSDHFMNLNDKHRQKHQAKTQTPSLRHPQIHPLIDWQEQTDQGHSSQSSMNEKKLSHEFDYYVLLFFAVAFIGWIWEVALLFATSHIGLHHTGDLIHTQSHLFDSTGLLLRCISDHIHLCGDSAHLIYHLQQGLGAGSAGQASAGYINLD